jgi:hypothetical protein
MLKMYHTDMAVCEDSSIRDKELGHARMQVTNLTEAYHVVWKMEHVGKYTQTNIHNILLFFLTHYANKRQTIAFIKTYNRTH